MFYYLIVIRIRDEMQTYKPMNICINSSTVLIKMYYLMVSFPIRFGL